MKIEFKENEMVIIPEDIRDNLYLEQVLGIGGKKVFSKVVKIEGRFEDCLGISISRFDKTLVKN